MQVRKSTLYELDSDDRLIIVTHDKYHVVSLCVNTPTEELTVRFSKEHLRVLTELVKQLSEV